MQNNSTMKFYKAKYFFHIFKETLKILHCAPLFFPYPVSIYLQLHTHIYLSIYKDGFPYLSLILSSFWHSLNLTIVAAGELVIAKDDKLMCNHI